MHLVGGRAVPPRVPSRDECRWCDIGPADCPERIDDPAPPPEPPAAHDLF